MVSMVLWNIKGENKFSVANGSQELRFVSPMLELETYIHLAPNKQEWIEEEWTDQNRTYCRSSEYQR